MKFILNIPKIIPILLFVSIFTVSCSDDDNNNNQPQQQTIVELAVDTPELSTLVAALQAADGDLVNVLSGGNFTVLAPTNTAFDAFLAANGFASLDEVPTDVLSNILLNHVITGTVDSGDLIANGAGYTETNATNADGDNLSLYFDTSNGVIFNGISAVSTPDVDASNGVVHIVNTVIGLPTVVTFATADPTFETLVVALTREDLTFDYVGTLSSTMSPAPFTVFAPTNQAFADLLTELELSELGDISEPVLKATLDHHAVANANVRAEDLSQDMEVGTLGGPITISLDSGAQIIDANERTINIIATNVQAINGVIHAVDKVILPPL
ncbi:MAG: fasciclin domain-containing protein [Flavobacteriaceae bacterium]|nr:fasciclin domain-containing protein [Bacteroidia bacterium]MBT8287630.1 fasciclin domain-containing protein [Bacteroidia bacterium]NNF75776.1 fasciclin domain-containing protein [Flavobacteriaceae bacterium]NNK74029.1 fasciclin domain-containing protein [Flavobacteriaceae bacterium]